jgi:fermentation-respiration switch protein FrsA (DUF1100 family)
MKMHMEADTDRQAGLDTSRRTLLRLTGASFAPYGAMAVTSAPASAQEASTSDKTFPKSDSVDHEKVSFTNRLGITIVADLYTPRDLDQSRQHPALVVGHLFCGVKEQTSGLYAQTMVERGFITLAHHASYQGESGAGLPHFIASPEAFTEDFSAAVDYLGTNSLVDRNRIGFIGVRGSGGFARAAAQIDPV